MIRTTSRRTRKPRRCESCHAPIAPGDRYVASPGRRLAECARCAERYGRGPLVVAT